MQGMQVVRLNMSHGDHASHKAVVDLVREYNSLNRNCLAIMLDTKGPEVRSGDLVEPINMVAGRPLLQLQFSCCCEKGYTIWIGKQFPELNPEFSCHKMLHIRHTTSKQGSHKACTSSDQMLNFQRSHRVRM